MTLDWILCWRRESAIEDITEPIDKIEIQMAELMKDLYQP